MNNFFVISYLQMLCFYFYFLEIFILTYFTSSTLFTPQQVCIFLPLINLFMKISGSFFVFFFFSYKSIFTKDVWRGLWRHERTILLDNNGFLLSSWGIFSWRGRRGNTRHVSRHGDIWKMQINFIKIGKKIEKNKKTKKNRRSPKVGFLTLFLVHRSWTWFFFKSNYKPVLFILYELLHLLISMNLTYYLYYLIMFRILISTLFSYGKDEVHKRSQLVITHAEET